MCRVNQSLVNIDNFGTSTAIVCIKHTRCDLKQCLTSILKDRFVFGQRVNGVNQYRDVYVRDEYVHFECVECVGQAGVIRSCFLEASASGG